MTLFDFNKLLIPIKRKLYLLAGRAILTAIDNTTKTATIQVTGLKDETITGIEYLSPYGFEAMPSEGQCLCLFINGNRDQGIAVNLHNRDERPQIELDESQFWSKFGNYVKCDKDGNVQVNGNARFAAAFDELKTGFDELKTDFNNLITIFNAHVHPGVTAGGASTTATVTPGTSSTASVDDSKVETVKVP